MNKTNVLLVSSSLIVGIGTGVALVSWFTVKPFKILPPCDSLITIGDCVVLPFSSPSAISTPEQTPATTPEQSGKIDDHLFIDLTLRDVNFCGKIYKVKQVIIDGVDVVQRIAELATNSLIPETFEIYPYPKGYGPRLSGKQVSIEICVYIQTKTITGGIIKIENRGRYKGGDIGLPNEWIYIINIINSSFVIDNLNDDIYIYGGIGLEGTGFEGGLEGPIGKLK